MRIELSELEGGNGGFAHEYQPGELVLDDERLTVIDRPKITGRVKRDGNRVKLVGIVEGQVQVECDRCLKPVIVPVTPNVNIEYMTAADYQSQHAVELGEQDMNVVVFDGQSIDVDALVAEELQLALPDHVLCKPDCKGICSVCGADRNSNQCSCETSEVDPRWAALKKLVNSE